MKDDDDPVVEAWLVGPQHALERIPVLLRVPVLRRLLQKLEKRADAARRPTRRYRKKIHRHDDAEA